MSGIIQTKVKIDIGTIDYGNITIDGLPVDSYVAIGFSTNFDTLYEYDQVILEKVVAQPGTTAAWNLFKGQPPDYYMATNLYMSEYNYMESGEGQYELYFIDVTNNVRYGSRLLYDFDISEIDTKVYGYRIRYYQSINGIDVTEYATDFNVISRSTTVDDIFGKYIPSFRPCLTIRNLAYRGQNSSLKQNMMLREIEADFRQLNGCLDEIETEIDETLILEPVLLDVEDGGTQPYIEETNEPIFPALNDLYDAELQILLKLKYR